MTQKHYTIFKDEKGRFVLQEDLSHVKSEGIMSFEGENAHQIAIQYLLQNIQGEFEVYDHENSVAVKIKKVDYQEVSRRYFWEYGKYQKAYEMWEGTQPLKEDYYSDYDPNECSTCRGGGCIHCDPHSYIEGYHD